jgi:hypothetical protein
LSAALGVLLICCQLSTAIAAQATPEATPGASPVASPAISDESCSDVPAYGEKTQKIYDDNGVEELGATLGDRLEVMRPEELREAANVYYNVADQIAAIEDVPDIALAYHSIIIDTMNLRGNVLRDMSVSGLFAALAYTDAIDENRAAAQAAWDVAFAACGTIWSDEFPGGVDGGLLPDEED